MGNRKTLGIACLYVAMISCADSKPGPVTTQDANQAHIRLHSPMPLPPHPPQPQPILEAGALEQLAKLSRGYPGQGRYRVPTRDAQKAYRAFIRRCLQDPSPPAPPAGFQVQIDRPANLWLVSETPEERRGAGALLLRKGSRSRLVLEAPHTRFDRFTIQIASALFTALDARALLINTTHRADAWKPTGDETAPSAVASARSGTLASDVAHQPRSLFSMAHLALLDSVAGMVSVQIHGYASRRLPRFHGVLSAAGSPFDPHALLNRLQASLPQARFAGFPADTRRYGALSNAQARHSRGLDAPFLHVELSSIMRQRLIDDPEALAAFVRAFVPLGSAFTRDSD